MANQPDYRIEGGILMAIPTHRNLVHHPIRSTLSSIVAVGASSALMVAGLLFLSASPASAAGADHLAFTGQPSSTATAGSGVGLGTVQVTVQDSSNATVTTGTGASDSITLSTTSGSPTMSGYTATAVNGVATFVGLVVNTAGTYHFTATDNTSPDTGLPTPTPSSAVTVAPSTANKLAFSLEPPSSATAGSALATFTVSVEDTYGNVITTGTGATDTIALTSSCSLTSGTTAIAAAGVASFSALVIGTGTSCTLVASDTTTGDTGLATATSSAVSLSAGAADKVAFTTVPPTAATLGVNLTTFKVSIEDVNGNVVASGTGSTDSVAITSSSLGCTVGGTSTVTAVAGVATFSAVTFTAGSSCTLTATDSSRSLATATSAAVLVSTNAPAKLGFTSGPASTSIAGIASASFQVSVEESNGIVVTAGTGSSDTVTITSTCALAGTTTVSAIAGVATFSTLQINTAGTCSLVATDASRTLTTATSPAIAVAAGTPTHLVFTTAPPSSVASAGTTLATFRVSVEDVFSNVETSGTGATDLIAITSTCPLGGTTSQLAVAGVATFSAAVFNGTGSCTLIATDTSRTLTTATSTVTVGQSQAALQVTSLVGTLGTALKLTTSGGSGTGAVTFSATNGTATGCTISGSTLAATSTGTCHVTATKAATTTYLAATSPVATVTFIPSGPRLTRVVGKLFRGRTMTVTIVGSGFYGRPRIITNVAGLVALVTRDTGTQLRIVVTVPSGAKAGVHVLTVILANGKRASVRFNLR